MDFNNVRYNYSDDAGEWASPLKPVLNKRERHLNNRICAVKKLRLDDDVPHKIEITDIFIPNYDQYNFHTLPAEGNSKDGMTIRHQITEIEKMLHFIDNDELANTCRKRIKTILLENFDFEYKISELSMIIFYLDNEQDIPDNKSLLAFRANALQKEVDSYIESHKIQRLDYRIPDGVTHYLLRAFVHMVLTSAQVYNPGGLVAIARLLTTTHCQIARYLQPEHVDHIVTLVRQILSNCLFENLFQEQHTIHQSLEDIIRLDLKLPKTQKIESIHIMYGCLMALFTDVRQKDEPNCYAISTLIYAIQNNAHTVMSQMLKWLASGHYSIGFLNTIPIRPLVELRLSNSKDFEILVDPIQTQKALTIQHIVKVLNLPQVDSFKNKKVLLRELLNGAEKGGFEEQMFYCYKNSGLVNMQIALIEFIYTNSDEVKIPLRKKMIDACIRAIVEGGFGRSENVILQRLEVKLRDRLWLESRNEKEVNYNHSILTVGSKEIMKLKANGEKRDAFSGLFRNSLRVFSINSNKEYNQINSILELKKVLVEEINETFDQLCISEEKFKGEKKKILKAVDSARFIDYLVKFCAAEIGDEQIKAIDLKVADLFILKQQGGNSHESLKSVYGIDACIHRTHDCENPNQFLKSLLDWFKSKDSTKIYEIPKIAMQSNGHVWTLTPSLWEPLLQQPKNSFDDFIKHAIYDPAQSKLNKYASSRLIDRVISRYSSDEIDIKNMSFYFFNQRKMSLRNFRDRLIRRVPVDDILKIKDIIEDEYSKISINQCDLDAILKQLNIRVEHNIFQKLLSAVTDRELTPVSLAKELRLKLIKEGIQVVDPFQLELLICKHMQLPLPVNIGDLNWMKHDIHYHLIIKISFVYEEIRFFERRDTIDVMSKKDAHTHFSIYHPNL